MNFEQTIKKRFSIIIILFAIFVAVLFVNLISMMLFSNLDQPDEETLFDRLTFSKDKQSRKDSAKLPVNILKPRPVSSVSLPRGAIYDRNLEKLAFSIKHQALVVDKKKIIDDETALSVLADIVNIPYQELRSKLNSTRRNWIELLDNLDDDKILKNIRARLKKYENAFSLQSKYRRVYPHRNLLSHLLGYVSRDNRGLYGVEYQFDDVLSGNNAKNKIFKEPIGILFYDKKILSSFSGSNVVLTIDYNIQQTVERELDLIQEHYNPKTLTVIVMKPKTGEILALANRPDFDPNEFNKVSDPESLRNYAISDWYEPGSTMKIVTAAMLVNENLIDDSKIYTCTGKHKIYDHTYHCFNKAVHGDQTFAKVIANSCNIGIIKAVTPVHKNTIYKYLINFGFGITTGLELPGERAGSLRRPDKWSGLSKYSISIGQELTVTALQLINSLMVIPNGGELLQPTLVKEIRDDNNNIVETPKIPNVVRRVITEKTARKTSEYLTYVVEDGTGAKAAIKGIEIAGKTGTAQIMDKRGGYSKDYSVASFFGYFPAEDPQFAMIVIVNQSVKETSGGLTAAPAFKNIALRILEYQEKYPPANIKVTSAEKIPEIYDDTLTGIVKPEKNIDIEYAAEKSESVFLDSKKNYRMPDLTGKSKRDCINILSTISEEYKINIKIEGSGYLYFQNIKPASIIKKNDTLILKFRG